MKKQIFTQCFYYRGGMPGKLIYGARENIGRAFATYLHYDWMEID